MWGSLESRLADPGQRLDCHLVKHPIVCRYVKRIMRCLAAAGPDSETAQMPSKACHIMTTDEPRPLRLHLL